MTSSDMLRQHCAALLQMPLDEDTFQAAILAIPALLAIAANPAFDEGDYYILGEFAAWCGFYDDSYDVNEDEEPDEALIERMEVVFKGLANHLASPYGDSTLEVALSADAHERIHSDDTDLEYAQLALKSAWWDCEMYNSVAEKDLENLCNRFGLDAEFIKRSPEDDEFED